MNCRILYLVGQLGPGGSERQLCLLLQKMDRERYRPEVVVWSFQDAETYVRHIQRLDVALHRFPHTHTSTRKMLAVRRIVQRIRPEIVHSYSFYTNVAAYWATLGTKIIPIGAVRSDLLDNKRSSGSILGRLSARWPNKQIYNNFAAAENARNSGTLFAPRRVFVVQNGLDLQQFQKIPLSNKEPILILGVGSLLEYKRWDRLLRVALKLKQRGLQFLVEIVGGGPLRECLERQIHDLEIADRVRFAGHTDDVAGVIAKSTVLAHTSDVEGCPNVIMEAMACGRAVVAMEAGDIPYLVDDGRTGFVIPRGDEEKMVECLAELIANHNLCLRMGEAGRNKAEREFGLERFVERTFKAYRAAGWSDS